MPTNQILPFAIGSGANVLLPADYAALPAQTSGFSTGIASSQQLNTVWRQSSFVSSMLAQFICDQSGLDVLDNGDVAGLKSQFTEVIMSLIGNINTDSMNVTSNITLLPKQGGNFLAIQNAGVTLTLPAPLDAFGKVFYINNYSAGDIYLYTPSGNFNPAVNISSTFTLPAGCAGFVLSDSANWVTFGFGYLTEQARAQQEEAYLQSEIDSIQSQINTMLAAQYSGTVYAVGTNGQVISYTAQPNKKIRIVMVGGGGGGGCTEVAGGAPSTNATSGGDSVMYVGSTSHAVAGGGVAGTVSYFSDNFHTEPAGAGGTVTILDSSNMTIMLNQSGANAAQTGVIGSDYPAANGYGYGATAASGPSEGTSGSGGGGAAFDAYWENNTGGPVTIQLNSGTLGVSAVSTDGTNGNTNQTGGYVAILI